MRTMILFAALLWSTVAVAYDAPLLSPSDAPIAQKTPADDDEEEDPTPGTKPGATPAPAAKPEEKKEPAPAAMGAVSATPAASNTDAQKLVSGAPLFNPNVAVHIVEEKAHSDRYRHEIILFPVQLQINAKFTQHYGLGAQYVFHLQENFGFQISGYYNAYAEESAFNGELIEKGRVEAQAATSLLNTWGAMAGVEVTPFYGKFAFFSETLAHFSVVLSGSVGLGGTRHQLKPANLAGPATYGDTGLRFLGGLGGGFRLQIGKHFAFRLEFRDVVYTARADSVNGCNSSDLRAMNAKLDMGMKPSSANVSSSCNVSSFEGKNPQTGVDRSLDVPLANNLVKPPISSDVLNNLGLYLGFSFIF